MIYRRSSAALRGAHASLSAKMTFQIRQKSVFEMLRDAEVDQVSQVMRFDKRGVSAVGEQIPEQLFVRDCWRELYDRFQRCHEMGSKDCVITGTPGIGKSHFKFYWMAQTAKQGVPILWEFAKDQYHYFSNTETKFINCDQVLYTVEKFGHFADIEEKVECNETARVRSLFSLVFFFSGRISIQGEAEI